MNYDSLTAGGSGGGARTQTRTTQIGRTYEKYAIETKSEAHSRQTTPIPTQPRTLSSVPTSPSSLSKENKLQERVNKMKQAYKESRFSSDTENNVLNSESLDGHEATSNEKEAKQEESNDQEKLDSEAKEKAKPGQNNEETQLSTEKKTAPVITQQTHQIWQHKKNPSKNDPPYLHRMKLKNQFPWKISRDQLNLNVHRCLLKPWLPDIKMTRMGGQKVDVLLYLHNMKSKNNH